MYCHYLLVIISGIECALLSIWFAVCLELWVMALLLMEILLGECWWGMDEEELGQLPKEEVRKRGMIIFDLSLCVKASSWVKTPVNGIDSLTDLQLQT